MRRTVLISGLALFLLSLPAVQAASAGAMRVRTPAGLTGTALKPLTVTEDECTGEVGSAKAKAGSLASRSSAFPASGSQQQAGGPDRAGSQSTRLTSPVHPSGAVSSRGGAATHPDFNGDGFADLAIAVTCEDVGAVVDAGAVNVIYGSANGLDAFAGPGNQWWTQDSPGILDQVEPSDDFGHVVSVGDFNGDGFDDLVVQSREDLEGQTTIVDAGALNVIYGSSSGLSASAGPGNQFWTLNSPGVIGKAAKGDLFGRALAAGDFNADGFQDLAIGIPQKDGPSGVKDSGAVSVLLGSSAGLTATGNQVWSQDSPGILDQREFNDQFGRALTTADFNGDGFIDLGVGARHESLGLIQEAGAANVIYGSPTGLSATGGPGNQFWTEDSPGLVTDGAEAQDWWGRPIKSGDFNNDGYADLAVGSFKEDLEGQRTIKDAGAATIIYGGPNGLAANAGPGNQWWTQDSPGILDQAEGMDWFSRWDAVADFNNDGFDDLLLGAPGEDIGQGVNRIDSPGTANVIYGSANGLAFDAGPGNQLWSQDSTGILDQAETHDWFAHGNEVGADFNGDGYFDIAIGVIFEDVDGAVDAGAVNVIYGSAGGLTADAGPGNQFWSENSPGIAGDGAEASDAYGGQLAAPGGD